MANFTTVLNDEGERRGASPASNEGTLLQSSTSSLAHRRYYPRDRSNGLLGSKLPAKLENPPLQQYRDNSWYTKYQQKDRKLLVQGVPGLSDTHPKIDTRDPQPKRDKYRRCSKCCARIVA